MFSHLFLEIVGWKKILKDDITYVNIFVMIMSFRLITIRHLFAKWYRHCLLAVNNTMMIEKSMIETEWRASF